MEEEDEEKETLKRTNSANSKLGLTILLNSGWSNYRKPWAVKNDYVGWKILAHNPLVYPEVRGKGLSVNAGNEAFISIKAQVYTLKPRYNKPRYSEFCDIMNKTQLLLNQNFISIR